VGGLFDPILSRCMQNTFIQQDLVINNGRRDSFQNICDR